MEPRRGISTADFESMSERSDSVFLPILLDIMHPAIRWLEGDTEQENGHLRLVNDVRSVKYKGDDREPKRYMQCSFSYKAPKEDGKQKASASISISCVDSRTIEVIRSVPENLRCRVVALYGKVRDDESGKEKYVFSKISGHEFEMKSVTWDGITASWQLDSDSTLDLSVPRDMGSSFRLPSVMENN